MSASEDTLNSLHELIAQVLVAQVGQTVKLHNPDTDQEEDLFVVTPATVAIAVKFLKDNEITTAISEDTNLGELQDMLAKKQKRGRAKLATVSPIEAAQS